MRRSTGVRIGLGALVAGIVAAAVAGSIVDDPPVGSSSIPVTLISGFHSAGEKFDLGGRTVDRGRYVIGYSLEVKMISAMQYATMDCMIVDLSGALTSIDQPLQVASANGIWTRLSFTDTYELPEVTLSIRCTPNMTGDLSASFRNVSITAQETKFIG